MNRLENLQQQFQSHSKTELVFEDEGRIAVIYLNSPKDSNCLSITLRTELMDKLKSLERNNFVKVVVLLSKAEKVFCAGANIKEINPLTYESQIHSDVFHDIGRAMSDFKKPLICGVNGGCFGGGFEVALASDIIVAREDAKFGLPEINLGLLPGLGGAIRLPKLVGKQVASRLILSGEAISAKRAYELGIISELLPAENFHQNVIKIAKKLSNKGLIPLLSAKAAISASQEDGLESGLRTERLLINALQDSKAKAEGTSAFVQKRRANFNDC